MHPFTFGSDPEFMLVDAEGNVRSAINIVQGTPDNRIQIGGNEFYHDNVNLEMGIIPGKTKVEVVNNFRAAFLTAAEMVAPFKVVPRASAEFDPEELDNPLAKRINCHPEMCAYTLLELYKPVMEFARGTFRTAAGHIHLGAEEGALKHGPMKLDFIFVVRCLDLFLGIPSLWMDHDPTSRRRRELYGAAGSHRRTRYGVEYRSLGNFWLASPKLVGTVYDVCEFAIDFVERGGHEEFWSVNYKMIDEGEMIADCIRPIDFEQEAFQMAINLGDKAVAERFLSVAESKMPAGLVADIRGHFTPVQYDFYKEWQL